MKKTYLMLIAIGMMGIIACESSKEDKKKMEAEETAKADSLFKAANQNMAATDSSSAKKDSTAK